MNEVQAGLILWLFSFLGIVVVVLAILEGCDLIRAWTANRSVCAEENPQSGANRGHCWFGGPDGCCKWCCQAVLEKARAREGK